MIHQKNRFNTKPRLWSIKGDGISVGNQLLLNVVTSTLACAHELEVCLAIGGLLCSKVLQEILLIRQPKRGHVSQSDRICRVCIVICCNIESVLARQTVFQTEEC